MTAQRSGGEGRLQVAGGGWRRGVGADAVAAAVERVGAAPSGLRRLVGRGRGFKDPSTDRCLCLRLAEVFVVQLPTRSSVNVCDRPPQGWPRRVACAASPGATGPARKPDGHDGADPPPTVQRPAPYLADRRTGRGCPARALPEMVPGEILAVLDTGAYQDATASNFNAMARPASVLVSGGEVTLIKRRETLDDITARDVPAPLTSGKPGN